MNSTVPLHRGWLAGNNYITGVDYRLILAEAEQRAAQTGNSVANIFIGMLAGSDVLKKHVVLVMVIERI